MKTVSAPVSDKAAVKAAVKTQVDVPISVSPSDYVCFGTIDKSHPECQKCQNNKLCAEATK